MPLFAPIQPAFALPPEARHPWVETLLAFHWPHSPPSRAVDRRDEMWRHTLQLAHGHRDRAMVDYFRAGLTAARTYLDLLDWWTQQGDSTPTVLDFASGWGRVTRFLTAARPELHLTASDISSAGLAFQERWLGVATVPSAVDPEALGLDEQFDAVLVSSLFTHLPHETFGHWVSALWRRVAPGGLLAFSTHPEEALPQEATMPESGLYFEAASEIPELETIHYGRTWVTAEFVEAILAGQLGTAFSARRFRRVLWHLQDLWILVKPTENRGQVADLATLTLDAGPDGRLDDGTLQEDEGQLWLGGWVAHPFEPQRPVTVEIIRDREMIASGRPTQERTDVVERLGERVEDREALLHSGFLLPLPLASNPGSLVEIRASDGLGPPTVLHLSSFEGLIGWLREKRLREERNVLCRELQKADEYLRLDAYRLQRLEAEKAAMQASRFWKLREWWWRFRGE